MEMNELTNAAKAEAATIELIEGETMAEVITEWAMMVHGTTFEVAAEIAKAI